MFSKKNNLTFKDLFLAIIVVLGFGGAVSFGFAQNNSKINTIKNIRFASHPLYTRLIFDLNENVPYKLLPDFNNGVISIIFKSSILSQKFRNKLLSDKRIVNIDVIELPSQEVRFDIQLVYTKNTFFHLPMGNPPRLVFDIKNKTKKTFEHVEFKMAKTEETEAKKIKPVAETEIVKTTEAKVKKEDVVIENDTKELEKESKIILARRQDEGKNDYLEALKTYQSKDYLKAREKFSAFLSNYPKSKYREDIIFLKAESEHRILTRDPQNLKLQPVINAYELVLGMYPESKYRDMALYKVADAYNKMGLTIESKANLNIIMDDYPEGRYALRARLSRAQILMDEKDFEFAYKELTKIVKKAPMSSEARDATFKIAGFYYDNRDYERAIKIYENIVKKWPGYTQGHPDTIYNMGESYFVLGDLDKARSQLFTLVNLHPNHELTAKSLNRIGEIYRIVEKNEASAKVFQETILRKPDSKEADYSLIRIADIGIINPSMKFSNLIFDYDSFYNPIKTYKDISKKYPQTNLAQMAMLREGIARAEEKSYTAAINKFKELLLEYPDTIIKEDIYALIKESFYKLVDIYYNQKGYLPLLATYHKNLRPYLKEIDDPLTLFRLGESYQAVGLYELSLVNYQKAKKYDKRGVLNEVLNIKAAQIYFKQKNYKKAELITKKFIKQYSKSKHIKDAMLILGNSLYSQGKYASAVAVYTTLLKKFPGISAAAKAYYYLADSYYNQLKYKEAIMRYEYSIKIYTPKMGEKELPAYIVDSYFKIGEAYYKNKKHLKAIKMYQRALKKNPNAEQVSLSQYIIAKSYNFLKQSEKAKAALEKIQDKPGLEIFDKIARAEITLIDWETKNEKFLK